MHSFVPASLVASATLISAVQGAVTITKPAAGDTVDPSQGFDIVWEYGSSDPTNWEIELGNPSPNKLLATNVTPSSVASGQTAQYTYHVAPQALPTGNDWQIVLDPRNDGVAGVSLPESGVFTIANGGSGTTTGTTSSTSTTATSSTPPSSSSSSPGTPTGVTTTSGSGSPTGTTATVTSPTTPATGTPSTSGSVTSVVTGTPSGSVVPPMTVSTGTGKLTTVTSASVISSTIVSGSFSTVVPQSTVFQTTVVPGGGATATGSNTASSTGALHTGAAGAVQASLGSAVLMALLPVFML